MRCNEQSMTGMARTVATLFLVVLAFVPGCSGGGDTSTPPPTPACLVQGTGSVIIRNGTQNVAIRMIFNGAVPSDAAGNQFIALPGQESAAKSDVVAGQFFRISAQRVDNNAELDLYPPQTIAPCNAARYSF